MIHTTGVLISKHLTTTGVVFFDTDNTNSINYHNLHITEVISFLIHLIYGQSNGQALEHTVNLKSKTD